MSEQETQQVELVRVRVIDGHSFCEDPNTRLKIHPAGTILQIRPDQLCHTVEVLDSPKPTKAKAQHRMVESPRKSKA